VQWQGGPGGGAAPGIGAGAEGAAPSRGTEGSVVVVGFSGVSWKDVTADTAPNLYRFGKQASTADLVVRTINETTCPTEGWLTLGAGQRTIDDAPACCIRHQGRELPLTQGEYRLLRTLLHRPGRVFSREELLTAMFGGNRPSDPHTINTHIRALRHKLRAAGIADEPIRTHHGLGYSFNET